MSKKGQVTIFIILAILIVAGVVLFFLFKDRLFQSDIPIELQPVYEYFDSCVEQKVKNAADLAGSQAGYITLPEFEAGSEYAPFSSQLDFFGFAIPYWYYLSQNGFIKEQALSLSQIETQFENYLETELTYCDFSGYTDQGYVIQLSDPEVSIDIGSTKINTNVEMNLFVSKGDINAGRTEHKITTETEFGRLYDIAADIYDTELNNMFLEEYAVDVMRLYAPVTGNEITCSPEVWDPNDVISDIRNGLHENIQMLKLSGEDYDLQNSENEYFVVEGLSSSKEVNFVYSVDWPSRVEIWPVENSLMVARPVGIEQGLGILGFCYVPYHFVYDIYFPVLVQVYTDTEVFQFPVAVIVDQNLPRNSLEANYIEQPEVELCDYKDSLISVYTYDSELNPVSTDISYECLTVECDIGTTQISGGDAVLSENFPKCINGSVIARADGYLTESTILSTNQQGTLDIILDRIYDTNVILEVDGRNSDNMALITFDGPSFSSIVYPEQTIVSLVEGFYNISVQVFSDSTLELQATSTRQCIEVPKSGIFGFFGAKEEECFDLEIPAQDVDMALTAGGQLENEYIIESLLQNSLEIELNVPGMEKPSTIEDLQTNYDLLETNTIWVNY